MATASHYDTSGKQSGSVDLPDALFAAPVRGHVLYEAVKNHLANRRQGTHKTKTRSEVAGQRSKLFRQKGTGRARAGSATSGLRVGGGTIHGPRVRDYSYSIPKKVRRAALTSALSDRAAGEAVHVIDALAFDAPSTRAISKLMDSMGLKGSKVLFVSTRADENLVKSCRNIRAAEALPANELNAYQVLRADAMVIEKDALAALEEVFGR